MLKTAVHTRKCLSCKEKFEPRNSNQIVCSFSCSVQYSAKQVGKKKAAEKKERKAKLEKLKTKSDHLRECQIVFNRYIRLRDREKGCISCGRVLDRKFDAGHYFGVGGNPGIRFNEDNVHGQCVHCNRHKHGNIQEYTGRLMGRIGEGNYWTLCQERSFVRHYSIPEILELKQIYKNKIKEFTKI